MRKFSGISVVLISVILVLALILSGCSSSSPSTSNAPPTPAQSSAAPAPTSAAPAPAKTTAALVSSAAAGGTIKIGLVSAFSGVFAAVAPYWQVAVQMAVDDANAKGGIQGKQIELVTRDDQGDPSIAVQKANELKAAGCVAIIGSLIESSDEAVFGWAKDNHMPFMVSQSPGRAERITQFNKYSFFPCAISTAWASVAAQVVKNNNYKSVAMMAGDTTMANELHDYFWPAINKLAPNTVTDKGFNLLALTQMDFSNTISSIIAKKPDVLINVMGGPPFAAFMQQAKQFKLFSQIKYLGWCLLGPDGITAFGKDFPTGLYGMDVCPYYLDDPAMKTFVQNYYAKAKIYPADITLPFFVGTVSLIQSIKSANSTDPDAIVKALETGTFDTPVGPVTFNDYDHQANLPIWVATSGYATSGYGSDFGIAIGLDPVKYTDGLYPTKDEVLAGRSASK